MLNKRLLDLTFDELDLVSGGGDATAAGTAVGSVAGAVACPYVGAVIGDLLVGPGGAAAGYNIGQGPIGQAVCVSVGGYIGGAIGGQISTESSQPLPGGGLKKRSN